MLAFPGAALADATIQATDGTLPDGRTTAGRRTPSRSRWARRSRGRSRARRSRTTSSRLAGWERANGPASPDRRPPTRSPRPGRTNSSASCMPRDARHGHSDRLTGAPPPPPPPPPLSEQPFVNDFPHRRCSRRATPSRPKLEPRLRRAASARARRVRLRLSKASKVTVKLTRGKTVKRAPSVTQGFVDLHRRGLRAAPARVDVSRPGEPRGRRHAHPPGGHVTVR